MTVNKYSSNYIEDSLLSVDFFKVSILEKDFSKCKDIFKQFFPQYVMLDAIYVQQKGHNNIEMNVLSSEKTEYTHELTKQGILDQNIALASKKYTYYATRYICSKRETVSNYVCISLKGTNNILWWSLYYESYADLACLRKIIRAYTCLDFKIVVPKKVFSNYDHPKFVDAFNSVQDIIELTRIPVVSTIECGDFNEKLPAKHIDRKIVFPIVRKELSTVTLHKSTQVKRFIIYERMYTNMYQFPAYHFEIRYRYKHSYMLSELFYTNSAEKTQNYFLPQVLLAWNNSKLKKSLLCVILNNYIYAKTVSNANFLNVIPSISYSSFLQYDVKKCQNCSNVDVRSTNYVIRTFVALFRTIQEEQILQEQSVNQLNCEFITYNIATDKILNKLGVKISPNSRKNLLIRISQMINRIEYNVPCDDGNYYKGSVFPSGVFPIDNVNNTSKIILRRNQRKAFRITLDTTPFVCGLFNGTLNVELNSNFSFSAFESKVILLIGRYMNQHFTETHYCKLDVKRLIDDLSTKNQKIQGINLLALIFNVEKSKIRFCYANNCFLSLQT